MLTTAVLTSSTDAANYYAKDNYYTKERGVEQSFWFGKGASRLDLSGQVDPDRFQELLSGKITEQSQLGRRTDEGVEHRSGWDFTFSAPKSVSLLSEVYGVTQVRQLHEEAVKKALEYAEEHLIQSRIMREGRLERKNTSNAVIAAFTHDVSREQDPQLHTHSIILNATYTDNGWRSVSNEQLFKQKKKMNSVYRQYLFDGLKTLGFTLRRSNVLPGQVYEIAGMSDALLEAHSNRAKQIKDYIESQGLEYTPALAKVASIRTRKQKQTLAPEELRQRWLAFQVELEKQGVGVNPLLAKVINGLQSNNSNYYQIETSHLTAPLEINKGLETGQTSGSFEWRSEKDLKGIVERYTKDWLAKKSLDTLMVLSSKTQKRVNLEIRDELKKIKILHDQDIELRTYEKKYLKQNQLESSKNYAIGDLIQLEKSGEKFEITRVEENGVLIKKGGKLDYINLSKTQPFAVYRSSSGVYSNGEKIRITDSLPEHGIKKNFIGLIESVSKEKIKLRVNGKLIELENNAALPIDYGYSRIVEKAQQLKKSGSVLLETDSDFYKFSQLTGQNFDGHYAYTTTKVEKTVVADLAKKEEDAVDRLINNALEHLLEKSQSFTSKELELAASYFSGGQNFDPADIAKALHRKVHHGEVLAAPLYEGLPEKLWTTPQAIERERHLDELLGTDLGLLDPILSKERAELTLSKTKLNESQQQAIAKLLSSKNRFSALQGDPGVGKTFALNQMKKQLQKKGYNVFAMAPTHQAVSELKDSLKIEAMTIDRYLVDMKLQNKQGRKKDVWLVDESSMATTSKMIALTELAIKHDSRIVFIGDYKQLESVGAGRAFEQVCQSQYIDLAVMDKRLRQKTDFSKTVVTQVLDKEYDRALASLADEQKLKRGDNEGQAIDRLVSDYLALPKQERDETLIVAPANEQRFKIDAKIREKLKNEKTLGKQAITVSSLADSYLTESQKRHSSNYKPGQYIRFNQDIRGVQGVFRKTIKRSSYFKVLGVNPNTNSLILKSDRRGEVIHFNPSAHSFSPGGLVVYDRHTIELRSGDSVKWTDNQNLSLLKNAEGQIVHVDKDFLRIRANGKNIKLSTRTLKDAHLRHNYAKTAYGVQGQTAKRVFALMEGFRKNTVNQRSFMVGLTRASHDLAVYTSQPGLLPEALRQRTGDNRIAKERGQKNTNQLIR